MDGKVEMSELKGAQGAQIKARFAALDTNKDGVLDANELKAMSTLFASRRE